MQDETSEDEVTKDPTIIAEDRRERVRTLLTAACAAQRKGCHAEVLGHLRAASTVIGVWSDEASSA